MKCISFLFLTLLILSGCSAYKFESKSHFVDGVDEYFNLKIQRNIWGYMDFVSATNDEFGVRLNRFYPNDLKVLNAEGLKGKDMRTLFSVVPKNKPYYHLVVLAHQKDEFDYSHFEKVTTPQSIYFYKDNIVDSFAVRHILIPFGKNERISMIHYIDTAINRAPLYRKLTYLAEINAKELQKGTPFNASWQILDCDKTIVMPHRLKFRKDLLKKNKVLYAKLYALYGEKEGIHYAHILTKDSPLFVDLELCPNEYRLDYVTPKGVRLDSVYFDL